MREILFKAKRIDNGEWVEGYYQKRYDEIGRERYYIFRCESNIVWEYAEVDANTLCQYTGLTDKNGCKIWEGDILEWEYQTLPSDYYECVWLEDECAFAFKHGNDYTNPVDCWDEDYTDAFCLKVVGNIFDNPELLEVGD